MRRIIVSLLLIATLFAPATVMVGGAYAVDVFGNTCGNGGTANNTDVCQTVDSQGTNSDPIITIIKDAITILSIIIGIAAVIGVIVSGIRFVISAGDASAVASARSGLITSLAGVAVAALAGAIVAFVLNKVN